MVPTARARTAATASSAAVPTIMRSSVSHGTGYTYDAVPRRASWAEDHRGGGGDQPGHEGDRADHDGLGGQHPAPARARGQRDADQAPPVLGGDEHRRDHDHRDQPGERADEVCVIGGPPPACPGTTGAMSPDPVTVNRPPAWWKPADPRTAVGVRCSPPVHAPAGQVPRPADVIEDGGGLAGAAARFLPADRSSAL
jgi:hypothetical protein